MIYSKRSLDPIAEGLALKNSSIVCVWSNLMSNEDKVIHNLPVSPRNLHKDILARISAQSEHSDAANDRQVSQENSSSSTTLDIYSFIARIQLASSTLKEASQRVGELEAELAVLQKNEARTSTELGETRDRCANLKRFLASAGEDVTRAEALAAAAQRRANELELELAITKDSLETLLAAIETALPHLQREQDLAAA